MSDLLRLDFFAAGLEDANLLAVGQHLDAHAIGLAGRRVEQRDVGLIDRHRLVDDSAGRALERVRLDVLLHDIDAFDDQVRLVDALGDRERLISIAAHELRGPLCSVRLCLQSLQRSRLPLAPKATRMLEIMAKEERRVARLIDDLLDLGRIRSGQLELDLSTFDLCELVREVSQEMEPQAATAGSKLTVATPAPVVGRWDRSRLNQVVSNLLSNAIKYGQGRPVVVRVSGDSQGGWARLEVTDNGLGIAPELHGRIFEPFKRAVTAGRHDGLGLGLYIVRSIVEQLGGAVHVDSRPGAGATFVVELPVQVTH